jgi:hypothetical protein
MKSSFEIFLVAPFASPVRRPVKNPIAFSAAGLAALPTISPASSLPTSPATFSPSFASTPVASRALPWFESYTDQDWITKMRCDTTVNEEPTLTADMIGFTESVV